MKIEITDNRQEWLIGMAEELAVALREEQMCEREYRAAVRKREQIQNDIERIGGYIIDARKRAAERPEPAKEGGEP